ncbi:D-alanyl-D-alanine carboxypeptidase family protein [Oceanobacillus jeddahense]|uniref:D-alanyl-D-alanine carboxypeptidase family protein n=1 Tax=Oceanobacillus jeddahense TaxID=1462527 RepID=A0ABY5JYD8_9BACI|nr:D-alanyl-D-alanine carboxypeptidase family protein [Oceanobacillus jeddahense]UUI04076.1 D-alanyl-D-alanine carboxypeptidase family protein [Oceanobacillus jeddahense]
MQGVSWVILSAICFMLIGCEPQEPSQSQEDVPASEQTTPEQKHGEEDKQADGQQTEEAEKQEETEVEPPDAVLQKFDTDEAVLQLKNALNAIGYDLEATEEFDEGLTWAITDFQIQSEDLLASGFYDEATRDALLLYFEEGESMEPGEGLAWPPEEAEKTEAGTEVVSNPYDELALVNKSFALPDDYIPEDLIVPDVPFPFTEDLPQKYMRENAAHALEELFEGAEEAGLEMFAQSGYRSYDRQDDIFAANASQHGEDHANTYSARPGESEHQTGLAMDVTSAEVNLELVEAFGETEEGQWLAENAPEYGFIIRFPEGKEDITEYQYEPWHLRYVGEKTAKYITEQGITLEEYYEEQVE